MRIGLNTSGLAVALLSFAGAQAHAAPASPAPSGVVEAVSACRKLTDDAARLACYDAASSRLEAAQTKGDVVVVDREQVRSVRRQAFGFQLPSLALFPSAPHDEAVDHVTAVIDHASQTLDGKWLMVTQDDAAWMQSDSQEIYADPHRGSKLVVRKGALGSFFCNVDGQRAVRCRRQS